MTSSPAPDLDELERLFDSSVGADFLPVGWQAVFGHVPALIAELRAAREAAESGRLREALAAVVALQPQVLATIERQGYVFDKWPPEHTERWTAETLAALDAETRWQGLAFTLYTDICQIGSDAERALLETPSAPSDHGASGERLEAGLAAMYAAGHSSLIAELCDEHLDRSGGLLGRVREYARLATPSVPPEPASPEAT